MNGQYSEDNRHIDFETERVVREKEWHNQAFGTDIRSSMEKYYSVTAEVSKKFKELLFEKLDNNTIFLDYGCGTGSASIEIFDKIKKCVGIDISEARIEQARLGAKDRNIKNIEFFVMDAMNTVFNDEQFDVIQGSAILHHLNLELSLTEIKRILKSDGSAFFWSRLTQIQ
ncbi:MAG: class I SAM-dependent methyltransferase [Treponema sp.]|jgi:ubiquinone/menaquinone biosynthesis C-methylase UbiE|nr:class I SAM-dependent methyltransferase [Treponema sp.]